MGGPLLSVAIGPQVLRISHENERIRDNVIGMLLHPTDFEHESTDGNFLRNVGNTDQFQHGAHIRREEEY
jgi:hypothetical protein